MSSESAPKSSEVLVGLIQALQNDADVVDALGDAGRISIGSPADEQDDPVVLRLSLFDGDGTHRGTGATRHRHTVQASVIATRDWRESNGILAMREILDHASDVLDIGGGVSWLVPRGPGGTGGPEMSEGQRTTIAARWRYQTTHIR
ncbi:hypothetical protein [Halocalculus aciditolerans]|uniref:DUF3168 domain-containing protein n=1 Tax=Halocalculus aciditolerans TaxID=1383812 RepID=A0A830F256_9EURY|nr:hypothetical protein [Halocalculus aciditolerans]GGL55150.1 hypothetical protein GCM10009039_11590 [Halocalculus aciditolerans]